MAELAAPPNRECLVIGASGFLGAHIVERFLAEGWTVTGVVRSPGRLQPPVRELVCDLTGPHTALQQARGVSVAVLSAAVVDDWGPYRAQRLLSAAVHRRLFHTLAAMGIGRLVLVSATTAYGRHLKGEIDETCVAKASGELCGDTKVDAETLAWQAQAEGLLEVTVLRPATCYGAGDRRFLPQVMADLKAGRSAIIGDGTNLALLCHARHVADLCCLLATHAAAPGQAFQVCDRQLLAWRDVLGLLARAQGVPAPRRHVPRVLARALGGILPLAASLRGSSQRPRLTPHVVELLTCRHTLSLARVQQVLGYTPRFSTEEGLLQVWCGRAALTGRTTTP